MINIINTMYIFYYFNNSTIETFKKINNSFNNIVTDVNNIKLTNILIYDITNNDLDNEILKNFRKENIIIILDETNNKINGLTNKYNVILYNSNNINYFIPIIEKVRNKIIENEYYYYKYL
jgi:hypothetical protein